MMNLINQDILQEVESKKGLNITLQKTWENFTRQVNNEFCDGYKDRYSVPKVDFFMEDIHITPANQVLLIILYYLFQSYFDYFLLSKR